MFTVSLIMLCALANAEQAEQNIPFQILGHYDVAKKSGGLAIPEAAETPT